MTARRTSLTALTLGLLVAGVGCSTERPTDNPPPVSADCTGLTEVCVLPYPSSRLTAPDPASPTGFVVSLSDEADFADHWATLGARAHDGFSPSTSIATWLRLGGDPTTLPPSYLASLEPDASIQLVVADATSERYGERVPFAADLVASSETGSNLLMLTPLVRLAPASRYAVVVTNRLLAASGSIPEADETTAALLSNQRPDGDLGPLWDYHRDLVHLVEMELGLDRSEVVQLWDFHTATEESRTSDIDDVAAGTAAWIAETGPTARVEPPRPFEGHTRWDFTFDVPLWHSDGDQPLNRGPDGIPEPVGTLELHGVLLLPQEATEATPAVPLIFGHALSATAVQGATFMADLDLGSGPYAVAAIDWDLHGRRGSGLPAIIGLAGGLNTPAFATAMIQSASDTLVLTHVLKTLGALPDRGAAVDAEAILYLGQSLGALVGALAAAINDDLEAVVLNVGGGTLSQILRDGEVIDIVGMRDEIEGRIEADPPGDFPEDLAYDVALVQSQLGLDAGDPATLAPRFVGSDRPLLLQWSADDGVVPNRATETFARTAGLTLVTPSVRGVAGLPVAESPTCGDPPTAMSQFLVSDNAFNAHLALDEDTVQEQAMTFFASMIDESTGNDGDIRYGRPGEPACDPAP